MSDFMDVLRRAYLSLVRGTFVSADDSKKMQEMTIRDRFGEIQEGVEYWQPHGFTHVPLPPDKKEQAEVLVAYLGGSAEHPIVVSVADRRHRPKNLKPGDVAFFDHRKQITTYHKDGITKSSPLTVTTNVVDDKGKVLSSIVQHKGSQKVTISTKDGATLEMNGPNITKKPGAGGKIYLG